MTDLLSTAFENLKSSISNYETLRSVLSPYVEATRLALQEYYRREREFNHQLSLAVRESGEVPAIAQEALDFQRLHGFHGRGTAKIISVHSQR